MTPGEAHFPVLVDVNIALTVYLRGYHHPGLGQSRQPALVVGRAGGVDGRHPYLL